MVFGHSGDDPVSHQAARVVGKIVAANRGSGLELQTINVSDDAAAAAKMGITDCPEIVLMKQGHECFRVSGTQSHRGLLQLVLPEIYDEPKAVLELRRQLRSPGEDFPRTRRRKRKKISQRRRVDMLREVPLFAPLSRSLAATIAKACDELAVQPGVTLIAEGSAGAQFFVIIDGEVKVSRKGRKVATGKPGDWFGEMALIDGQPRSATVSTVEESLLLSVDRAVFLALLESEPRLSLALLEVLSLRLRAAEAITD